MGFFFSHTHWLYCVGTNKYKKLRALVRAGEMDVYIEDTPRLIHKLHAEFPDVAIYYPRHHEYTHDETLVGVATPYYSSSQLAQFICASE